MAISSDRVKGSSLVAKLEHRVEFSPGIRVLVAKRAGYRCSFPGCSRTTVSAAESPDKSTSIGVASHIFSAVPGGPRGSGGLSREELKSSVNAIWLCRNHADLIDKNDGVEFPASTLISYKALHEARIVREMEGTSTHFGWVESLLIHSSPLFSSGTRIDLGKLSLFIGNNGVGKTAICEWLSGPSDLSYLEGWCCRNTSQYQDRPVDAEIRYLDPMPHTARFAFSEGEFPRFDSDGRSTSIPVASMKVIFPKRLHLERSQAEPVDELAILSETLGMSPYLIRTLCTQAPMAGVSRLGFEQRRGVMRLVADVEGAYRPDLSLRELSHSERERVVMAIAALAANEYSLRYPTILILDSGVCRFDGDWLKRHGQWLSSPAVRFQTIGCLPPDRLNLGELQWAGWKLFHFEGTPPEVRVRPAVRA